MGFFGINEQNKQRINVSLDAYRILLQDISDFNMKNMNSLLNTILAYIKKNNLTTDMEIEFYKASLKKEFDSIDLNIDRDEIINKLVLAKMESIRSENLERKTHMRNQKGFYFRLSNSCCRWLESDWNHENKYFSSLEHYLNTAFSKYTALPYSKREEIVLDPLIDLMRKNISDRKWLSVYQPGYQSPLYLFPVCVLSDNYNTHIYLACYRLSLDNSLIPATYRLSSLSNDIETTENVPIMPSDDEYRKMYSLIEERGIQFLSEEALDITVRLSPFGIRTFNRTLPMRPKALNIQYVPDSGDAIYSFHSTQRQALYYFLKFGKDALILEPDSLRQQFVLEYESALEQYKREGI